MHFIYIHMGCVSTYFVSTTYKRILWIFCIFTCSSTVDGIVTPMLSGKWFIHIEQMNEMDTVHINELGFLEYWSGIGTTKCSFRWSLLRLLPFKVKVKRFSWFKFRSETVRCINWINPVQHKLLNQCRSPSISAGHHGKFQGLTSQVQVTGTLVIFMQRYLVQFDIRQRCTQYYLWQSR